MAEQIKYICKTCRVHTAMTVSRLGKGWYELICSECSTVSPIFDHNGIEVPKKEIIKETQDWR